jgi:predicted phosphodiesterase
MRGWPLHHVLNAEGLRVCLQHYALVPTGGETLTFRPYFEPTATAMEDAFSGGSFDLVFYGHLHRPVFTQSPGTRYYALMSSGTGRTAEAAYTVVDLANGQAQVCHKTIQYDDQVLFTAMEHRQVPAREFLYQAFYGGRFTPANENPAE